MEGDQQRWESSRGKKAFQENVTDREGVTQKENAVLNTWLRKKYIKRGRSAEILGQNQISISRNTKYYNLDR